MKIPNSITIYSAIIGKPVSKFTKKDKQNYTGWFMSYGTWVDICEGDIYKLSILYANNQLPIEQIILKLREYLRINKLAALEWIKFWEQNKNE